MTFFKKHHGIILNIFLISLLGISFFGFQRIVTESKKNLNDIVDYSQALVQDSSDIEFNTITTENFELYIEDELLFTGNTLNSFVRNLEDLEYSNSQKKIYINIYSNDDLTKTEIYKYSDFGYKLDTTNMAQLIKTSIIKGDKKLSLRMNDYVFFDQKLLNKKVDEIKTKFTENNNGTIYFSNDSRKFLVNTNKVYLSSFKEIKQRMSDIYNTAHIEDSLIDILLETKENINFEISENLNDKLDILGEYQSRFNAPITNINTSALSGLFESFNLSYTIQDAKLVVTSSKGFLNSYIQYNEALNQLELNEEKFDRDYGNLSTLTLTPKQNDIVQLPSLHSVKEGGITENYPSSEDFQLVQYGAGFKIDYLSFKKQIKQVIDLVNNNTEISEFGLLEDVLIEKQNDTHSKLSINNIEKFLISKKEYIYNLGDYSTGDTLQDKYINYGEYPFSIEDKSSNTDCNIINNIELYCEDILIGKLGYKQNKIILKDTDDALLASHGFEQSGMTKSGGIYIFERDSISISFGALYHNITIENNIEDIAQTYLNSLFPSSLSPFIDINYGTDKLSFHFKSSEKKNMLIKSAEHLDNYYVYIYKIEEIND